jgi:pilus assembly protein FimV
VMPIPVMPPASGYSSAGVGVPANGGRGLGAPGTTLGAMTPGLAPSGVLLPGTVPTAPGNLLGTGAVTNPGYSSGGVGVFPNGGRGAPGTTAATGSVGSRGAPGSPMRALPPAPGSSGGTGVAPNGGQGAGIPGAPGTLGNPATATPSAPGAVPAGTGTSAPGTPPATNPTRP